MKIINFKNNETKLVTKEQHELSENAKICYICQETFEINIWKIKTIVQCQTMELLRIACRKVYAVRIQCAQNIPSFHNESNYDYNFTTKEQKNF